MIIATSMSPGDFEVFFRNIRWILDTIRIVARVKNGKFSELAV